MFACGDASNVNIPAMFVAYTMAQLLSSLMPPGSLVGDALDGGGSRTLKTQHLDRSRKGRKATATAVAGTPRATWGTSTALSEKSQPPNSGQLDQVLAGDSGAA